MLRQGARAAATLHILSEGRPFDLDARARGTDLLFGNACGSLGGPDHPKGGWRRFAVVAACGGACLLCRMPDNTNEARAHVDGKGRIEGQHACRAGGRSEPALIRIFAISPLGKEEGAKLQLGLAKFSTATIPPSICSRRCLPRLTTRMRIAREENLWSGGPG